MLRRRVILFFTSNSGWKLSNFFFQQYSRLFDDIFVLRLSPLSHYLYTISTHFYVLPIIVSSQTKWNGGHNRRMNTTAANERRSLQINKHFPRGKSTTKRQNLLSRIFSNAVNNKPLLSVIVSFFYLEYKKIAARAYQRRERKRERETISSRRLMLVWRLFGCFHCRLARVCERETGMPRETAFVSPSMKT